MDWKIEFVGIGQHIVRNADFWQRILNPDGTVEKPKPLDEKYIELVSEEEINRLPTKEITRFEKIGMPDDNHFEFELENGEKSQGKLKQNPLFYVVLAGFIDDLFVDSAINDIDIAERL